MINTKRLKRNHRCAMPGCLSRRAHLYSRHCTFNGGMYLCDACVSELFASLITETEKNENGNSGAAAPGTAAETVAETAAETAVETAAETAVETAAETAVVVDRHGLPPSHKKRGAK